MVFPICHSSVVVKQSNKNIEEQLELTRTNTETGQKFCRHKSIN